jgi:N-acetylmuramoyl-L-alanine amidase
VIRGRWGTLVGLVAALAILSIVHPGAAIAAGSKPLAGRTIVLDPGHNGGNGGAPGVINRQVAIGQGQSKACNTTGTATNAGYAEAAYTWDVALRARRVLRRRGATIVMTRNDNHSVGPCVDERARIANRAHADAAVSIHADGGPASGFGFHVIEPARIVGLTDDIFGASHRLALDLRATFRRVTGEPYANYIAHNGLDRRSDLGGLRLADVPAVFIETGNMRNAGDAGRMIRASYRLRVARGIADGIQRFLTR